MKVNRQLYRDTEHGQIAGVCAGIANFFGLERWLVRILVVTAFFLLAGPFIFVGYIACWFILEKKPKHLDAEPIYSNGQTSGKGWRNSQSQNESSDHDSSVEVKTKVWQAGQPPGQVLTRLTERFSDNEQRLRKMEKHVTSREFLLNREINRL
ncbi:envelope stress response membrane protein PspC [Salinimonas marina]|uniref:Envelope stress response membrane protein PspC n=1 Tax=Salinimonas marina TaxID=2785918 RepID=A0A7S9DX62_9ALTE|nr:envelope stress response membrane protein PspC [Salinimonas marina]QPG04900.1 envelope stress response membrane protein PspC [Salinimonas marina]